MKKQVSINKLLLFFLLFTGTFISCKRDRVPLPSIKVTIFPTQKVYVVCEGNYGWGNAAVSMISLKDETVIEDYFKYANNRPLGDVCQSINTIGDKFYVIVNNSQKIEVLDTSTFKSSLTLSGFNSPRYICDLGNNKALVSELYSNKLYYLDLSTNSIESQIPFHGWSERMLKVNQKVFIANVYSNKLYVFDIASKAITDSIDVGKFANSMVLDKNSKLWVLCSGNNLESIPGKLCRINLGNYSKEFEYTFGLSAEPKSLVSNFAKDSLWYIYKDVYSMAIASSSISNNPIIHRAPDQLFNGLAIEPSNSNIWISNAKDYQHKGEVIKYNAKAVYLKSFPVGLIPTDFLFK